MPIIVFTISSSSFPFLMQIWRNVVLSKVHINVCSWKHAPYLFCFQFWTLNEVMAASYRHEEQCKWKRRQTTKSIWSLPYSIRSDIIWGVIPSHKIDVWHEWEWQYSVFCQVVWTWWKCGSIYVTAGVFNVELVLCYTSKMISGHQFYLKRTEKSTNITMHFIW
jgi:hypothetical protein